MSGNAWSSLDYVSSLDWVRTVIDDDIEGNVLQLSANDKPKHLVLPIVLKNEYITYLQKSSIITIKQLLDLSIDENSFIQIVEVIWTETRNVLDELIANDENQNGYQYFDVAFGYLLVLSKLLNQAMKAVEMPEIYRLHPYLLFNQNRFVPSDKIAEYQQFLVYMGICGVFGPNNARTLCLERVIQNRYIQHYLTKFSLTKLKMKHFTNQYEENVKKQLIPYLDEHKIANEITEFLGYANYDFLRMCCYCLGRPFVEQVDIILQRQFISKTNAVINVDFTEIHKMKLSMLLNKCRIQTNDAAQRYIISNYMKFDDSRMKRSWLNQIKQQFLQDCIDGEIMFHENSQPPTMKSIDDIISLMSEYLSSLNGQIQQSRISF